MWQYVVIRPSVFPPTLGCYRYTADLMALDRCQAGGFRLPPIHPICGRYYPFLPRAVACHTASAPRRIFQFIHSPGHCRWFSDCVSIRHSGVPGCNSLGQLQPHHEFYSEVSTVDLFGEITGCSWSDCHRWPWCQSRQRSWSQWCWHAQYGGDGGEARWFGCIVIIRL